MGWLNLLHRIVRLSTRQFNATGVALLVVLAATPKLTVSAESGRSTGRSIWHTTVTDSAFKAELLLVSANVSRTERAGRIFIPVVSNRPSQWLCRMVRSVNIHVAPYNNTNDMFVFSVGNKAEAAYKESCGGTRIAGTLHFMALNEHWTQPRGSAADTSLWSHGSFGHEYRTMVRCTITLCHTC